MHTTLQSPKKKRANKRRIKFLMGVIFVVIGLLFWGAVQFFSLTSLQIAKVTVRGAKMTSEKALLDQEEKTLSDNYYYFFSKKNVFFYPKGFMKNDILSSFPTIASVALSVGYSRELVLDITEREPVAIWCGREKPTEGISLSSDCFYVDKTAYIFKTSPRFSGNAYFVLYGQGLIKNEKGIGQHFISPAIFQKVIALRDFLSIYDIPAGNIFFGENNYAEFFDENGFTIKWNTDQDIDALESNMRAIFQSPSWKGGTFLSDVEQPPKPLEYLDFRFGNKIFYRQKGFVPEIPILPVVPVEMPTIIPDLTGMATTT